MSAEKRSRQNQKSNGMRRINDKTCRTLVSRMQNAIHIVMVMYFSVFFNNNSNLKFVSLLFYYVARSLIWCCLDIVAIFSLASYFCFVDSVSLFLNRQKLTIFSFFSVFVYLPLDHGTFFLQWCSFHSIIHFELLSVTHTFVCVCFGRIFRSWYSFLFSTRPLLFVGLI